MTKIINLKCSSTVLKTRIFNGLYEKLEIDQVVLLIFILNKIIGNKMIYLLCML